MLRIILKGLVVWQCAVMTLPANSADSTIAKGMQLIKAGEYRPLYLSEDSPLEKVDSFYLDKLPVTNADFYHFIKSNINWSKLNIPSIFSEQQYLAHWDMLDQQWQPTTQQLNAPVTLVSWFAAQAYCEAKGKRLPQVAEWEYVARASETSINGSDEANYNQTILNWYSLPTKNELPAVGLNKPNFWGIHDMHGLIWEWTEDFNSTLVSGESRADSTIDSALFCGAGAAGAADPKDYAAFMRFGFRSSLQAKFTLLNLGFRCALNKEY